MAHTRGTRVTCQDGTITPRLGPGEYCRDALGRWWVRPPLGSATLGLGPSATVTQHEDGTITVREPIDLPGWSGTLTRGTWEGGEPGPTPAWMRS